MRKLNGKCVSMKVGIKQIKEKISMSITMSLSRVLERGMVDSVKGVCQVLLEKMHEDGKLLCEVSDGMRYLDGMGSSSGRGGKKKKTVETEACETKGHKKKRDKPSVLLPYCGVIEESWCLGVRYSHGLHTQCTNDREGLGEYCKTCVKGACNSASGKPPHGDIRERSKLGLEYRDPKGKQTICYANVAAKLGIDLEKAKETAVAFGWTIPEEQLVVTEKKRGRPKGVGDKKKKKSSKKALDMSDKIAELVAEAGEELLGGGGAGERELEKMKSKALDAKTKLKQAQDALELAKIKSVAVVDSSSDEEKELDSKPVMKKRKKKAVKNAVAREIATEDLKAAEELKAAEDLKATEELKVAEELKAVEKAKMEDLFGEEA